MIQVREIIKGKFTNQYILAVLYASVFEEIMVVIMFLAMGAILFFRRAIFLFFGFLLLLLIYLYLYFSTKLRLDS